MAENKLTNITDKQKALFEEAGNYVEIEAQRRASEKPNSKDFKNSVDAMNKVVERVSALSENELSGIVRRVKNLSEACDSCISLNGNAGEEARRNRAVCNVIMTAVSLQTGISADDYGYEMNEL